MLRAVSFIVNHMPWLIKMVLNMAGFVLARVVRYRSQVIMDNLRQCFGHKMNEGALKSVRYKYYATLIRYLDENLERISKPTAESIKKISLKDAEKWQKILQQAPTIILASHYGNWEYNLSLLPALTGNRTICFYKPLSSRFFGNIMAYIRNKHGVEIHPSDQAARVLASNRNLPVSFVFIADQTPLNMNGVYWNSFLSRRTPWLTGAEKIAVRYGMQVVYIRQQPMPRGSGLYYRLEPELITYDASKEDPDFITEKYTRLLEAEIEAMPEYWLWSHRRWKRAHLSSAQ